MRAFGTWRRDFVQAQYPGGAGFPRAQPLHRGLAIRRGHFPKRAHPVGIDFHQGQSRPAVACRQLRRLAIGTPVFFCEAREQPALFSYASPARLPAVTWSCGFGRQFQPRQPGSAAGDRFVPQVRLFFMTRETGLEVIGRYNMKRRAAPGPGAVRPPDRTLLHTRGRV